MTKRLSTALSAIVLLAFAGCAATPEPAPPPPPPAPAPRPAAPPPPPAPAPKAEKITTASTVNFDFDRYVIRPDARSKLDDLVGKLRSVNLEVIIAVGHADRIGSDAYNMKLSVRRADSVKAYLVSKGIAASRIRSEERRVGKEGRCRGGRWT